MAITEEQKAQILSLIKQVSEIRSPGMSYEVYSQEFARYLAQAEVDKSYLLGAGLLWEDKALYDAFLFMLSEEHADRILAEGLKTPEKEEFDEKMGNADLNEDILYRVARFIDKRTEDESFKRSFKQIKINSSDFITLSNIITLCDLIATEPELALKIRPGQTEVNENYLTFVKAEAHYLIELDAKVHSTGNDRSYHVELQKKLITLCINATDEIIEFADAAFINDRDYFQEHYTNHVRRERYKATLRAQEEDVASE